MNTIGITLCSSWCPWLAYRNLVEPSFVTTLQVTFLSLQLFVCKYTCTSVCVGHVCYGCQSTTWRSWLSSSRGQTQVVSLGCNGLSGWTISQPFKWLLDLLFTLLGPNNLLSPSSKYLTTRWPQWLPKWFCHFSTQPKHSGHICFCGILYFPAISLHKKIEYPFVLNRKLFSCFITAWTPHSQTHPFHHGAQIAALWEL